MLQKTRIVIGHIKNKAGDCQHPTHQNGPGPIFMTFLTKRTEQNVQIVRF